MRLPRSHPRSRPFVSLSLEEETRWILRCQSGDSTAFRFLVESFEERAFWVAFHMVGHEEDARDVVQDAFIRAYAAISQFRAGRRFFTWFYRIVLHLAVDCLRKRGERTRSQEAAPDRMAREDGLADSLIREEYAGRVQDLLQHLPPRVRAILVLRDIEGVSAKDIADVIRSNPATVRWWLFLARKQFRCEWERRYGKEGPCD